jgi:hypothetical protein
LRRVAEGRLLEVMGFPRFGGLRVMPSNQSSWAAVRSSRPSFSPRMAFISARNQRSTGSCERKGCSAIVAEPARPVLLSVYGD